MTNGGRALAHQRGRGERDEHDDRGLHRDPPLSGLSDVVFRAFAISPAIRSSSDSVKRAPSPPSSAATVFSAEPSKKVSTRCFNADFRAVCRGTAATYT